ncbi:hypothetical protein [Komagataeibacter diospyri]|uniref:hypothetical protein n=1 Tax=Komagataeibacter diospyri TaxID=1932662 RepID=UPI00114337BB|nr:hypothetical protein [Komagataeibacter diospyri]
MFADEAEQRWWRHTLSRFLSSVDVVAIATDTMRALREKLLETNELVSNASTRSVSVSWESSRGVTRSLLAREGVDIEKGVDAQMLSHSEALYENVVATSSDSGAKALAVLWGDILATIAFYDAHADILHDKVEQPVWGHVSNAIECIAGAATYAPGVDGMPSVDELLDVLRRLWASRFPEVKDKGEDSSLSWSNWDVRVYAGDAYVSLAGRFGADHREIVDMFDAVLADPVPQVRLQAVQNLQVLSHVAPEKMWALAERIAQNESHIDVLGHLLHDVIPRFIWRDVERCKMIIEIVRARSETIHRDDKSGRDTVAEQLGSLTAQLWCWQNEAMALEWLKAWGSDPVAHHEFCTAFLSMLRGAFFARYMDGEKRDTGLSDRSQQAAMIILDACLATAEGSYTAVTSGTVDDAERNAAIATYNAAETVIGHLMSQLYFGSGAYADNREGLVGLISPKEMHRFLVNYRPMLSLLAASHEPSTHHHLVQLYEFLIPGDPVGVFDSLHALLTGVAKRAGYHHESLAASVIVRMITRYIADYRSIFEDDARRIALIEILRLFSDVGWPEALKLLYDLPDLLR